MRSQTETYGKETYVKHIRNTSYSRENGNFLTVTWKTTSVCDLLRIPTVCYASFMVSLIFFFVGFINSIFFLDIKTFWFFFFQKGAPKNNRDEIDVIEIKIGEGLDSVVFFSSHLLPFIFLSFFCSVWEKKESFTTSAQVGILWSPLLLL